MHRSASTASTNTTTTIRRASSDKVMTMVTRTSELPNQESVARADEALRTFRRVTPTRKAASTVTLRVEEKDAQPTQVPKEAFDLFLEILAQMANGNAVTIVPVHAELTTQQAADILNVSRPFLIQLLKEKKIPFRSVGTHRRINAVDVFNYKQRSESERKKLVDELAAEAQKHDLGY